MREAIAWKRAIVLFPICLTIALFLFGAQLDLRSLSPAFLAVNAALAVVSAGIGTAILLSVAWGLSRLWRLILSRVTLFTLRRAIETSSRKVAATGIGSRGGELIVSLPVGIQDGITRDAKFWATTATGERLGIVECVEVSEASCLCMVFAILNEDFWADLEARKSRDPSPPMGVDFVGYIPEGFLVDVQRFLRQWEVSK